MRQGHRFPMGALVAVAIAVTLALIPAGGQDSLAAGEPIYVDADATGANNGASWEDAFTDLQLGLDAVDMGVDEVRPHVFLLRVFREYRPE